MFPRFRAPETMTTAEQAALLRATAAHPAPRDHVLYSMALGTGLRLSELLGLNVGDVSPDGREVLRRVTLDPATTKGGPRGRCFLPSVPRTNPPPGPVSRVGPYSAAGRPACVKTNSAPSSPLVESPMQHRGFRLTHRHR